MDFACREVRPDERRRLPAHDAHDAERIPFDLRLRLGHPNGRQLRRYRQRRQFGVDAQIRGYAGRCPRRLEGDGRPHRPLETDRLPGQRPAEAMVRRLVLDELLRRRERRQRQGAVCRVGRLHEGRRHRHQHRFLAFHLPRQHLVQDTQEPEGDDRVRLLGNEGQHAPLVGYRHLLDDRGPRHVHACHAPRLPGRRPARPGNQQYDHLGRMVRPLLYEQLHGTPHDGQFQPRMGNRRRAARRDAGCQSQLLQDRQPAPGGQRNLQPAPHLREVGANQPL